MPLSLWGRPRRQIFHFPPQLQTGSFYFYLIWKLNFWITFHFTKGFCYYKVWKPLLCQEDTQEQWPIKEVTCRHFIKYRSCTQGWKKEKKRKRMKNVMITSVLSKIIFTCFMSARKPKTKTCFCFFQQIFLLYFMHKLFQELLIGIRSWLLMLILVIKCRTFHHLFWGG